jgi:TRAP-type C4-dicarboxylate transport system permease small subunit
MKIYLSISLLISVLFMTLFGVNIFILLATAHATKNPVPDLMLHGTLCILFSFQAYRAIHHLRNILKRTDDENIQ